MNAEPITQLYHLLTRPHPSLTEIEARRGARLLAALMLTVIGLSLLITTALLIREGRPNSTVIATWIGIVITAALYFANRSGRYRFSANGFVVLNFALLNGAALATRDVTWLLFAPMMLIITAILLPVRAALVFYVVSIAAQIILGGLIDFSANVTYVTTFTTANVFLITGALVLVFIYHRAGIERERRAALRQANQQLRESEAALEQRVDERTRELKIAKDAAEAALRRAEQADAIKSQFLASMSHELRTPLNAILNFTEFVALGMFGAVNEQQKDALNKSIDSGRHLLSLINDVLDITKIEAGMMSLFVETDIDVRNILPSVIETAHSLLKDNTAVRLVTDIDADLPPIDGDQRRIRQVLLNLLANACKFTSQGSITLSIKRKDDHLLVVVSDTGVGIPPEHQQRIFQPFQQTEDGTRQEGTGLGLPIAQWIVTAHGGRMWLESNPGEGASFYFTLPVKQPVLMGLN